MGKKQFMASSVKEVNRHLSLYCTNTIKIVHWKLFMVKKAVHIMVTYCLVDSEEKSGEQYQFKYRGYSEFKKNLEKKLNSSDHMDIEEIHDLMSMVQPFDDPNSVFAFYTLEAEPKRQVSGKSTVKKVVLPKHRHAVAPPVEDDKPKKVISRETADKFLGTNTTGDAPELPDLAKKFMGNDFSPSKGRVEEKPKEEEAPKAEEAGVPTEVKEVPQAKAEEPKAPEERPVIEPNVETISEEDLLVKEPAEQAPKPKKKKKK